MREIPNKDNERLLKRYEMICKNKGLTEGSIEAFCRIELPLFLWYIGDMPLSEVTHITIEDYLDYCINKRDNASSTIARKCTAINCFFETMIRKDYLEIKNPMYKIDKIKVRHKEKDYLTEKELDIVINYLKDKGDLRGLAIVHLMYSSACRISEICQLNKDSLDFETRSFKVKGKGDKERICPFSEEAGYYIKKYLETRTDELEPLFISREKNSWNKRTIQRYVKDLMKAIGIRKHITPHSFRHSILTHLRLSGVSIEDLQLMAGHSSVATTQQKYTHVGIEDIRDKIDNFFNKKKG